MSMWFQKGARLISYGWGMATTMQDVMCQPGIRHIHGNQCKRVTLWLA